MISVLLLAVTSGAWLDHSHGWSPEVAVRDASAPVVRFSARVEGNIVLVRAVHSDGWHTYAMDNEVRANRALRGKKSLGVEQGIAITTDDGQKINGRWMQSAPHDFSKPELRWFTYGFEKTALFACELGDPMAIPTSVRIRGQACSGETCLPIDLRVESNATDLKGGRGNNVTKKEVAELLKTLVKVESIKPSIETQIRE